MSTPFYDLASLVVVPSGYKASKVYAQKPLTTDGQLTFSRASTATRVNSAGLIETVSSNVPRLDYLGSTCPKLLLEPSRTNVATWSEQANQYSLVRATIGSNVLASPDGTSNADSLIEDGDNGAHAFYNFGAITFTAAAYTASVFAKKGSRDWCALQIYDGTQGFSAFFNLNTGVAGTILGVGTSTITSYGNGWYRCTITATTAAGSVGGIAIYAANADNSISYAGTNGLTAGYFYGWQLELGAYATSYVKTEAAAVTRLADTMSKTLVNSNSNFSLFLELDEAPLGNASGDWLALAPSNALGRAYMYVNSFGFADAYGAAASVVAQRKFAWTQISSTTAKVFSNGVLRSTGTGGSYSNPFNLFSINGNFLDKAVRIKQLMFFDAPITDAQAIELTTL